MKRAETALDPDPLRFVLSSLCDAKMAKSHDAGNRPTLQNNGKTMPILNRAAEMQDEIAGWRRHIHRTPELGFDLFQTAATRWRPASR